MAELVDALASGASVCKYVEVQVLSSAPDNKIRTIWSFYFIVIYYSIKDKPYYIAILIKNRAVRDHTSQRSGFTFYSLLLFVSDHARNGCGNFRGNQLLIDDAAVGPELTHEAEVRCWRHNDSLYVIKDGTSVDMSALTTVPAIANETDWFMIPLFIYPVDGILLNCRQTRVIFWCYQDNAVCFANELSPANNIFVSRDVIFR